MQRIFRGAGFSVFDMAIATAGVVVPDTLFEVGTPQFGSRTADSFLQEIYGVDMVFDGDFFVKGNGDLQRTRGLGAFKASFARSLAMPKGDVFWRPEYGIGLVEFLNRPATASNISEIKNRIRSTLGSDPAVETIARLDVKIDRATVGLIEIFVDVAVSGQPVSVALAIGSE